MSEDNLQFFEQQREMLLRFEAMQQKQMELADAMIARLALPVPVAVGVGAIDGALRKLQEKDLEFPMYDGNAGNVLPRRLSAIILSAVQTLPRCGLLSFFPSTSFCAERQ